MNESLKRHVYATVSGRFHFIKGLFRNILLRVVSSLDILTHLRGTIIIREGFGKREISNFYFVSS